MTKNRSQPGFLDKIKRVFSRTDISAGASGDTRMIQKNNNNLEYVGKLYMGSSRQEVDVVWDTGSSWTTINDHRCDATCEGLVYDTTTSEDFNEPKNPVMDEMVYGSSYLEGYAVYDRVCVVDDPDACIPQFKYFTTQYVEGMDGIYGIVGMSTGFTKDSGPVLVPALYEAGVISEPVFGWYLTGMSEESYLDIGLLHEDSIREGEELIWMPVVNNDYWWTNYITGIKIGDNSFSIPKRYAMTDSGTSCTYAPTSLFYGLESAVF
jgi:hypothetical protein